MITGIIYEVTSPSNKKYYGQTICGFNNRKQRHLNDAKKGCEYRFHQALRKYNFNFKWKIIESYTNNNKDELISHLNVRETYWIIKEKTYFWEYGYNMSNKGTNKKRDGWKHSEETKKKYLIP